MKNIQIGLLFVSLLMLCACNPKVTRNIVSNEYASKLDADQHVYVLEIVEQVPENAKYIGELKFGDTGFSTNCDYNKVISDARIECRKVGANIIKKVKERRANLM